MNPNRVRRVGTVLVIHFEKEIDRLVYQLYGFTEEELDFIINYDIKYRMGDELNDNEKKKKGFFLKTENKG